MRKIAHSVWVKLCLILLVLFSGICAIYSTYAISFSVNYDLFDSNKQVSYYDTNWCHAITANYAQDVIYSYLNGMTTNEIEDFFHTNPNFAFALYDEKHHLIASTEKPEQIGYETTLKFNVDYGIWEGDNPYIENSEEVYTIQCYVANPLTGSNNYTTTSYIFTLIDSIEGVWFLIAGISILLCLGSLICLICVAGHRPNTDEIVLNIQDKIPLDIYAGISFFGICICVALAEEASWAPDWDFFRLLILTVALLGLEVFSLASILTFATRLKKGSWWKNSILYRFWHHTTKFWKIVWHNIKEAIHALPVIWKVVVVWFGISCLYVLFSFMPPLTILLNIVLLIVLATIAVQWQKLHRAGKQLAEGNLDYKIDTNRMISTFKQHSENLNNISKGIAIALEQKMKSERLRTELITNVSHDIKTPLTSIINYVDLLKKEDLPEQASNYVDVLDRQSNRLKKLTEDLVEASKASTGNIQCHLAPLDIAELIQQSIAEYSEKLEKAQLEPIVTPENAPVFILADGNLMWRVLSNLLNNVCKYAQPNTRLYFQIKQNDDNVWITVKNISREQLNIAPDELMERFVRGDSSRSTEGSGLGLNIARSLVELQKGKFQLSIDGDLFKAQIRCVKASTPQPTTESKISLDKNNPTKEKML